MKIGRLKFTMAKVNYRQATNGRLSLLNRMKRYNLKLNILVTLSLCLTGLIVFGIFHFFHLNQKKLSTDIHLSNPMELEFFETAFKFNKKELDLSNKNVVAGIIPHHLLAADLLAEFFYNLQVKNYETIILIGHNHFNSGNSDIITSNYNWQTPTVLRPLIALILIKFMV